MLQAATGSPITMTDGCSADAALFSYALAHRPVLILLRRASVTRSFMLPTGMPATQGMPNLFFIYPAVLSPAAEMTRLASAAGAFRRDSSESSMAQTDCTAKPSSSSSCLREAQLPFAAKSRGVMPRMLIRGFPPGAFREKDPDRSALLFSNSDSASFSRARPAPTT